MGRQRPGLRELIEKVVTSDPVARKVARAARISEQLGALTIPADRILQGNVLVPLNLAVGGVLQAGATAISQSGVRIAALTGSLTDTTTEVSSRISPIENFASLNFVKFSTGRETEVVTQAAADGSENANIELITRRGTNAMSAPSSAYVAVRSERTTNGGNGTVIVGALLRGQTGVGAQFRSGWLSIAAGATRTYTHDFGARPLAYSILGSAASDGLPAFDITTSGNFSINNFTNNALDVVNNSTSLRYIRVYAWKDPHA